jgi:hypothetical protein
LDNKWEIDLIIKLKVNRFKKVLFVDIKSSGEPRIIARVAGYLKQATKKNNEYPVIAAPFISSRGRDLCKELDIGFVDLAGNAFLKFEGVLIERWGRPNPKKEKRILKSLFSRKSTWIIRKLLNNPERSWTSNELSDEAQVSIGQVYKVTEKLSNEGVLEKKRGAIRLVKPGDLLDSWAKFYKFDDQDIVGYFCPLKDQKRILKALTKIPKDSYAITLGAAASIVAPFVRSTDVNLYTNNELKRLIDVLKLKPVEFGGNLYIITPADESIFFDKQYKQGLTLVSNLQLYLDLFNYPMRGREQADVLREKLLRI